MSAIHSKLESRYSRPRIPYSLFSPPSPSMASSMAHLALPRSSISRTIASRSRSRRLARSSGSALSYSTIPAVPVSSLSPPESAAPPTPRRLPPSTQLHIPAPASLVEGGVTRLYVNVATGVPGLLHSLAVIRAIEQRFGPVVDVSQTRVTWALAW